MNIQQIRYFTVLGEELHFRRAAARLHLSQPALSRSVQQLEAALGFPLLERSNRKVVLTSAGAAYLKGCRSVLATLDTTLEHAQGLARGRYGEVRIGVTDIAVEHILPHVIRSFRGAFPEIAIKVYHGCTRVQIDRLEANRLDVGFITAPWSKPGYETWTVQIDSVVAVLPERHRLARKSKLVLADFVDEPFVMGEPQSWAHYDAHLNELCSRQGFQPRVVQHATNNAAILGLVASGIGVSIQAETIRTSMRSGVVMRSIQGCKPEIPTVAVWRTDAGHPAQASLINHVKALYRKPSRAAEQVSTGRPTRRS